MKICFVFYKNGDIISIFVSEFENLEESEIIKAAKGYALGEPPNKECRRNLENVRSRKRKLIAVVEMVGFLGSPILNLIYPSAINQNVEICLDMLLENYLPMFQAQRKAR